MPVSAQQFRRSRPLADDIRDNVNHPSFGPTVRGVLQKHERGLLWLTGVADGTIGAVSDHGSLSGLGDDDHSQYLLLGGRPGGQSASGGTASTGSLTFYDNVSSSGGSTSTGLIVLVGGTVRIRHGAAGNTTSILEVTDAAGTLTGSNSYVRVLDAGTLAVTNSDSASPLIINRWTGAAFAQTGSWTAKGKMVLGNAALSAPAQLYFDPDGATGSVVLSVLNSSARNYLTLDTNFLATTDHVVIDNATASDVLLKLVPHASQSASALQVRNSGNTASHFDVGAVGLTSNFGPAVFNEAQHGEFPIIMFTNSAADASFAQTYPLFTIYDQLSNFLLVALDAAPNGVTPLLFPGAGGTVVTTVEAQTLSLKTMALNTKLLASSTTSGVHFSDNGDNSKQLRMILSGAVGNNTITIVSTAARNYTTPDADIIFAGSASALTSGRVPYATTGGLLKDEAALAYDESTDTLTATRVLLTSAAAPTPSDGHLWNDSTQQSLVAYPKGIKQTIGGALYVATASVAGLTSSTETTLVGSGVGSLSLPASFFVSGKTVRLHISYTVGSAESVASRACTFRIKKGTTALASWVYNNTLGGGDEFACELIVDLVARSTTSVMVYGVQDQFIITARSGTDGFTRLIGSTTPVTIGTTAESLDFTAQWDSTDADNNASCYQFVAEVLN